MAFEPFGRRSNIETNLALSEDRARRAETKARRNDLLKPQANMEFDIGLSEGRRVGPFATKKTFKNNLSSTLRSTFDKGSTLTSTLTPSTFQPSEFEVQGQRLSGALSQAQPREELKDTLANIFEERAQRQNFAANIAVLSGFLRGLGGKVGGRKVIRDILKNRQPTTLLEAIQTQAQLTGKRSFITPIGAGRTDPFPGTNKTLRLINVNGRLQQVFVDDETVRIQNLLQLLRSL